MNAVSHRIHLVFWLVLASVVTGYGIEALLSTGAGRPFGHTQMAHLVGWMGLFMIALTFVYPLKRRLHPNRVWPQQWFQVHLIFGLGGPFLILVHSGIHVHALVPLLALAAMVLVVFSGITGQAIHYLAFRTLYDQRHELMAAGLSSKDIDSSLHELALQEETLRWWRCLHGPLTWTFGILTLLHVGGVLYFGGL